MKILAALLCIYGLAAAAAYNDQFQEHELCMQGKSQSPIDLGKLGKSAAEKTDREFYMDYENWMLGGADEGAEKTQKHSKQDTVHGTLTIVEPNAKACKKVEYEAVQFHWHTPSEHTFENTQTADSRTDIEFHLVHVMKG